MKRREFISLLSGAAAGWPLAARGQQPGKVWRIGYLGFAPASNWASEVEALRSGFLTARIFSLSSDGRSRHHQMLELAAQLASMNVDVIFAPASTHVESARKVTKTIPIVFATHAAPVGLGDVLSLSRPGGYHPTVDTSH
jgi:putative ABC transport system substrate-binding protein